ncbi:xylulokinase [Shimia biformata]|uniref:xylulokinase n=1 Tax=Shimia biformata TaxID=1294299 RepID=UPI0019510712|nr:FGGY family carbohydrate kinase [Shimia biformata]
MPGHSADLVIAADFGTSGVKVGLVDGDLTILAKVTETYPIDLGSGGRAEQHPEDWWAALARALTRLRHEWPEIAARAGALVFSTQVCGVIATARDGTPLRPCLTWLDKRAAGLGQALIGGFPSVHGYQVGKLATWLRLANGAPAKNGMDPTAKMIWIRENEPDIFANTHRFLDVKDWLVHRATGQFTTSAESANLTWIMDTRPGREDWSEALARKCGLPTDKMAMIVDADAVVGTLTPQAAAELGLDAATPVLGGTSDVTAAALGSGAVADGELHISAATSVWIAGFFPGRRLSVPHSYATICSGLGYRPLLIATQESAGSAMEWAVKLTGRPVTDEELTGAFDAIGESQPDDPFFLPWLAGERVPVDNNKLRGTFWGLGLHHDANALRRAALEGVALNLRWAFGKVIRTRGAKADGPISLGGGVAANAVFAQTLADALNRDIRVGQARHAGVLGTATLAAPVMGWADTVWDCARRLQGQTTAHYQPNPDRVDQLNARDSRLSRIRADMVKSYQRTDAP